MKWRFLIEPCLPPKFVVYIRWVKAAFRLPCQTILTVERAVVILIRPSADTLSSAGRSRQFRAESYVGSSTISFKSIWSTALGVADQGRLPLGQRTQRPRLPVPQAGLDSSRPG